MSIVVYLSHPIRSRSLATEIHSTLIRDGFEVIDPFDRPNQEHYAHLRLTKAREFTREECLAIVVGDIERIEKSDVVVAVVSGEFSIGTPMEILCAFDMGKPVFCLWACDELINPWVSLFCTSVERSLDKLISNLKAFCTQEVSPTC